MLGESMRPISLAGLIAVPAVCGAVAGAQAQEISDTQIRATGPGPMTIRTTADRSFWREQKFSFQPSDPRPD